MEAPAELGVLRQVLLEDLDGHQAVEAVAAGLVDVRHAAGADLLQDLISVIQQFSYVSVHQSRSFRVIWFICAPPSNCRERNGHVVRCAALFGDVQQPQIGRAHV